MLSTAKLLLFQHDVTGKGLLGYLAVQLVERGYILNVNFSIWCIALTNVNPLVVK